MQLQRPDAIFDRLPGSGQKARSHAIGHIAQPEIEACRLHLVGIERRRHDAALGAQALDIAGGENAG